MCYFESYFYYVSPSANGPLRNSNLKTFLPVSSIEEEPFCSESHLLLHSCSFKYSNFKSQNMTLLVLVLRDFCASDGVLF